MKCAEININQNVWPFINKKNRSPPSQNILNIFLSQSHLIIARLNVMIADSNYLPSKSWSFEKEARFVNQSICIWWSHLSFTDKVCRQRRQRQFDDFFLTIFFRKFRQFCSILEISGDIICFPNRISHHNYPRCIEKFNYHMLFLISTANLTIFLDDFFRKCREFCSIL